jgi:hypothetical protein
LPSSYDFDMSRPVSELTSVGHHPMPAMSALSKDASSGRRQSWEVGRLNRRKGQHGGFFKIILVSMLLFVGCHVIEFKIAVAALAFLTWDILITLDDEIAFIWT